MNKNKDDQILPDQPASAENENKPNDDDRIDINKSIFQVNRELREKRQQELEKQQEIINRKIAERQKRKLAAHDKRIREEKLELLRLKQGLIEESDTIHEVKEEKVEMSFGKKVSNFFYHNKWWLGIGTLFAFITVFLVYSLVTKPSPDMVVLIIANNEELGEMSEVKDYVESFVDDFNDNGKTEASIYYIGYSDNEYRNYATGTDGKLTAQLQSADSVIVIGSDKLDMLMSPDPASSFIDLSQIYPDNPHVKGYKFMLSGTPFAERINLDPKYITDDLYIAVRTPVDLLYASHKDMEKTLEKDWEVFEKIVADLSE
ncbi:MAG: hypothetical protein J6I47_08235 [Ruminococcus sp.]|nr:hypothetical protein [Ruminococcus sp.]